MAGSDDLDAGLARLSEVVLDAQPYEDALRQVAQSAVRAVPGADGTSVCTLQGELPGTRVASSGFVRAVDAVQYGLGEGPCVDALRTARPVLVATLAAEPPYSAFGPAAVDLGVHSALAAPLVVRSVCVGTLNIYAHRSGAFDAESVAVAEAFAAPAAVVVANAQALELSQRMAEQLREAMSSRAVIEQAKGVLMALHGLTAEQAFARLRSASQTSHRKLRDVAGEVLASAAPALDAAPGAGPGG